MHRSRTALLALFVSLPLASWACLNDRDSDALVIQNKRLPDAIRVISGRFERNPPRYFQMRVTRLETELKANPRQFGLYDDLAVAHDRFGDDVTAMRVMAQKRALLPAYNAKDKANKEAWYRYYANNGTFRAHRFLQEGAKLSRISEMRQARDEIKQAIEIKPNAHFGRERVQLMVMDWIVAQKQKKTTTTLGRWIQARDNWHIAYKGEGAKGSYKADGTWTITYQGSPGDSSAQIAAKMRHRRETAEGLAGLVVLGAAWNSPDVFEALAHAVYVEDTVALHHMALLRCRELLLNGSKSFAGLSSEQIDPINNVFPGEGEDGDLAMSGIGINDANKKTLDSLYIKLRKEADQWNEDRVKWMEAKFEQGQHPDTTPNFWQGFQETAPPTLDVPWLNLQEQRERERNSNLVSSVISLGAILLFWVGLGVAVMGYKKRQSAKTLPT